MALKLCIIIATLNRSEDLNITLESIFHSSVTPFSIVIVDDSTDDFTKNVANLWEAKTNFDIIYLKPVNKSKGLTEARNTGLKYIEDSDIVLFLDDDVTLDRKYLEIIIKTFEEDSQIVGVQGSIVHKHLSQNIFSKLFIGSIGIMMPTLLSFSFYSPIVDNKFVIAKYPIFTPRRNKVIKCQWLSGCNMSYRAQVFRDYKFNEDFILYSLYEDLDFSYTLFKNKCKLVINFDARVLHRVSTATRITKKRELLMRLGYKKYLISKFASKKRYGNFFYTKYSLQFILSQLIYSLIIQKNFKIFKDTLNAYQTVNLFHDDIIKLELNSFNEFLLNLD